MASDLSIKKNAFNSTAQSSGRDADAGKAIASSASQGDQDDEPQQLSSRVTLSDDALKRMFDDSQAVSRMATETVASKKNLARARIEEIRKRIAMLKKMLAMMGPAAAKSVLREIRQLAGQLAAAAETLKEGSGGMPSSATGVGMMPASLATAASTPGGEAAADAAQASAGGGEQADAPGGAPGQGAQAAAAYAKVSAETGATPDPAAQQASGTDDAEGAGSAAASAQASEKSGAGAADEDVVPAGATDAASLQRAQARQREEDARTLREVLRDLKALLSLARLMTERGDEEARKDAAASEAMIEDAARSTEAIAMGGVGLIG
ncbi:Uncharacterised protein [Bordetella ansorpii]|uniref:Uncharacterized protein n=1 Tax=Bordetella ansorpii TaxID=288768 RepID=A0A157S782_9BORD|nr:hypothetical protein [Bordetella ansorpii]SAI66255.1 Uncharacterised protein [Bordetella ansorpii]